MSDNVVNFPSREVAEPSTDKVDFNNNIAFLASVDVLRTLQMMGHDLESDVEAARDIIMIQVAIASLLNRLDGIPCPETELLNGIEFDSGFNKEEFLGNMIERINKK